MKLYNTWPPPLKHFSPASTTPPSGFAPTSIRLLLLSYSSHSLVSFTPEREGSSLDPFPDTLPTTSLRACHGLLYLKSLELSSVPTTSRMVKPIHCPSTGTQGSHHPSFLFHKSNKLMILKSSEKRVYLRLGPYKIPPIIGCSLNLLWTKTLFWRKHITLKWPQPSYFWMIISSPMTESVNREAKKLTTHFVIISHNPKHYV